MLNFKILKMKKMVVIFSFMALILSISCSNHEKRNGSYIHLPEEFYSPTLRNPLTDFVKTIDSIVFMPGMNMNMISVNLFIIDDSSLFGRINAFAPIEKNLSIGDTVELVTIEYIARNDLDYERVVIIK